MNRRLFLSRTALAAAGAAAVPGDLLWAAEASPSWGDVVAKDWLARWEKGILADARNRYCDKELGEEIGWRVSPFTNGFYYGYLATKDAKWVGHFVDWTDAWINRGVKEPDGFIGWPKSGSGGALAEDLLTDSLLGEAMGLRPAVLMADEILKTPALKEKFGARAEAWLKLATQVFEKWDSRGCWREVKGGGLWVVPEFGIDSKSGGWTDGYQNRATTGFSNPANKQNHIARWLFAMWDVTQKAIYKERAEKWFRLMKSRMRTRDRGKYFVWNYWDPAGPWDYKAGGAPRHWVGVHPNGGYYQIDVEGIVTAFEHETIFSREDIERLVSTNRDFMWNQKLAGAVFQRIDGGDLDNRWKGSAGLLWTALIPYDTTLRNIFVVNHNPSSWGGLAATPWFLAKVASPTSNPL